MDLRPLLLALMTAAALTGSPKPAHADTVDDYLKTQMAARHIPGLSVAVVQDGKVVKAQGYGLSDVAKKTPATADTVYQIASLTKQFTAAATLKLREQGKLNVDDPASHYLNGLPAAWSAITVRELLNQTSGIPDYMEGFDLDTQAGPTPKEYTAAELIGLVGQKPLLFAPGTQYRYSNTNYHLLGMIIEKVSGHTYGDFMRQTFFGPLGMTHTQMARPGLTVPNAAQGTAWDGTAVQVSPFIYSASISLGESGIQTTVRDLAKWDTALNSDVLLSANSKRLLWTPPALTGGAPTGYASGWFAASVKSHPLLWHNGAIFAGFSGAVFKFPTDKLSFIVLTNSLDVPNLHVGSPPFYALTLGLAKLYLPDMAKEDATVPDTHPQVTRLLRRTLLGLAVGKVDADTLTPEMRSVFSPEALTQMSHALAPLKPLQSLSLLAHSEQGGLAVYRYRAFYGATPTIVLMALTQDGKIASWLGPRLE